MKYNNKAFILLFILAILTGLSAFGQNNWDLKQSREGIFIYSRKNGNSKFNELKVECNMEGKLSSLASVIMDINDHVNWVYSTKSASVIRRVSRSELYFYTVVSSPWPLSNRDLPVHLVISQDSASRQMTIIADCVPTYMPLNKNLVRVPLSKAVWKVNSTGNGHIHILYQLQIDVGGSVPAWIFNMFSTKGPFESFKKLREEVRQPSRQNELIPFIIN